ncbi:MAG TPA: flagellar hook-associated protein FlgK [Clostridiaceae bacterium]|nr:flagellar hook-associated protein FlgK [Clostridiaceae bacterium]
MRSAFFGLNVAARGLYSAQRNLDIINHNINNVNTPGYSRQLGVQTASRPMPLLNGTGMLGTGSEVVAINRVRDEFLDFKYWSENVSFGEWNIKAELLADMEVTFNEPSDSGFATILSDFFNALQELAKDPSSEAVRALVRQRGVTMAKYFNSLASHFEKLQADINYNIKTKVEEINSLAVQIQQLNRQIYISELDGNTANDLRDQRTLLVDKLSRIINIEANEIVVGKLPDGRDEKHFVITISGKALVNHFNVSKLEVYQRDESQRLNEEDIPNLYNIRWEDGNSIDIRSGELRGYLDIRDGNDGILGVDGKTKSPKYKGIPYYLRMLNEFVRTFAMAFNEGLDGTPGHADGYRLDSVTGDPPSDVRFFTIIGSDGNPISSSDFMSLGADINEIYKNITAKNFAVSLDIMEDLNAISCSGEAGEVGNIDNLNSLLKMRHNPHMFNEGAPEDFMKSLVATLGIDSQQAVRYRDNQEVIVKQIENRRLSVSGVLIDEEMANLVRYQHTYNACAKMITVLAEVYDTLINRMGIG